MAAAYTASPNPNNTHRSFSVTLHLEMKTTMIKAISNVIRLKSPVLTLFRLVEKMLLSLAKISSTKHATNITKQNLKIVNCWKWASKLNILCYSFYYGSLGSMIDRKFSTVGIEIIGALMAKPSRDAS